MAPKLKVRFVRKRNTIDELRISDEFHQFLCDTPSSSKTSDAVKFKTFLRSRSSNAPNPVNNSEKCERLSDTRELDVRNELTSELDEIRKCYARFDEKIEMKECKRKIANEKRLNDDVYRMSLFHQ